MYAPSIIQSQRMKSYLWPHDSAWWECQSRALCWCLNQFLLNKHKIFVPDSDPLMPGFYGSNKHSGAVWPGLNCSLQNRIQTESWGTRPAILFKLIGPDTDEKLLHGKHLETLHSRGIQIKAVCIYSDFVCFSINFLKHACRHPEKYLCVATRNSLMCEQVSFEWEILDKQIISYLSSFPPCRAPACGSRPRAWPCPPPWRSLSCWPLATVHRWLWCQSPITEGCGWQTMVSLLGQLTAYMGRHKI